MSIEYYEVFLNFRGPDTRTGFTDHLYHGLVNAGISVFKDDNELHQGEKIGPDLLTAIRNSKILIPIISVNYGQSRWCLDELVQIMECKKSNMGYTVLPIFYKVEPHQVRYQKRSFGKAFRTRSKYFDSTTMEKWKQALEEVSSLKGFDANGYEGELVKLVVQQVLFELKKKFELVIPKNLVGIDSHVKKVMEFVDNISCASLFVGIHGMGGIGKTTLAKFIYNKLSNQFEHRSFIADVRESCDNRRLVCLQNQLIKDILKTIYLVPNKDAGIRLISSKFKGKKVLILLDDVSNDNQLEALAGSHEWFSPGSVIIITTRNKHILEKAGVDYQYELEGLDEDNSLILFSRHAFRRDSPPKIFEVLTRNVVSTTRGLPLSLEVLGSFLCGKSEELWKEKIEKLNKFPDEGVQEKLMISYNELEREQKQIFLDIACFFINTDKRIATYMWKACEFFPEEGIEVLRFLSLIKVGDDHKLLMHDHLRDLGREIIRKENYLEPWNRSRLWDSKDVLEVLEGNKGTNKIEAIRLDFDYGTESYMIETFKESTKLRLLQLEGVHLTGDFQNLFPQLRWLKMDYHPDFELTNFHLKKLVVLDLSWSNISEDWRGWSLLEMATKLKVLNLSNCSLITTPNLSTFKSLEILILKDCDCLEEIDPSIENIKTLISLNVSCCQELKVLPLEVGRMEKLSELLINDNDIQEIPISRGCLTKLKTLNASRCRQLAQLPESLSSLMSLTQLNLSNTGFEELPESIGSLKKLKTLDASYCASLARIPNSIGDLASLSRLDLTNCQKLAQLPNSIGSLMSLLQLLLSGCHLLRRIPNSIGKLTSLTELHLKSTTIEELPTSIGSLQKLKTLDVSYCASLVHIPNSIGDLAFLSCLDLTHCQKLAQLPDSIGSLVSLLQLLLSGCHSLRQVPDSIGKLTLLTELHLKSTAIQELPGSIGSLQNLKILDASYCASLAHIPNSIGDLASLSRIDLTNCPKLAQLPDSIGSLVSLPQLLLSGCHSLRRIPNSMGKLTLLTELHLESTAIEELPTSIGSLQKLETLDAFYCASLACIPNSIGNLASLSCLDLRNCQKLAQLPNSIGSLVSLPQLILSGCHSLRQVPDSIGKLTSLTELHLESTAIKELPESIRSLKKLKTLDASYCALLAHIPNSIGGLASLSCLNLTNCQRLAQLPDSIGSLVSLPQLLLSGCHSLRQVPNSIEKLTSLTKLHLKSTAIQELPGSIGSLQKLETLDASYCASLAHIPNSVGDLASLSCLDLRNCQKLAQLPDSIGSLMSLLQLLLSGCHSLIQVPASIGKLTSLTELHLKSTAIQELPSSIGSLQKLETLDASYCASLVHIPNSIGNLASLSCLDLRNCQKLAQLPDSIGSLVSLLQLLLSGCHSLRKVPNSIGKLTSLTELHLKSTAIQELPGSIRSLQKLKTLNASYCPSLVHIPNSIGDLASLSCLDLRYCQKFVQLPDSIGSLVSLLQLLLSGCHLLRRIPDSIGKLRSLIELHLQSTAIEELPEGIGNMHNLRMLDISGTPMIELLDDHGILAELQGLRASGWKILEGPPNGQLVSPNNLDFDKLHKLRSRVLALVLLKHPRTAPTNSLAMNYRVACSEHVLQRSRPFGISNEDSESMADVKPKIADDSGDKSRNWKLTEISEPLQCRSIRLPDNYIATRVSRLIYTNSGLAILALSSNAVHKLWKWRRSDWNFTATTSVVPQLWQPRSGILMTNDISDTNPEDAVPCFALLKNDSCVMSASGGKISLFFMMTFKVMLTIVPPPLDNDIIAIGMDDSSIQIYSGQVNEPKLKGHRRIIKGFAFPTSLTVLVSSGANSQTITILGPPPVATFLAVHPQDDNTIAIGMEDSSIRIYNLRLDEFMATLRGHQKRITSLAFSNVLNVLVSSGADSQLCVWSTDGWEKQASKFLQMPNGRGPCPLADTRVQFHVDQVHLLVVHQTQIATCEAPRLELLKQWDTREASAPITDAAYSCNGQSIYVSFEDGSIGVLIAPTLRMRCVINPAAYIPPTPSLKIYPIVIAAHPSEPNQFALGLTNGSVYVLEPLESEGKWGTSPFVRRKRNRVRSTPEVVQATSPPVKRKISSSFR